MVGDPSIGLFNHGLTREGKKQTKAAVNKLRKNYNFNEDNIIIVSSGLLRTLETAKELLAVLTSIKKSSNLRERFMGDIESESIENIEKLYVFDIVDPFSRPFNAESLSSMIVGLAKEVKMCHFIKNFPEIKDCYDNS